MAVPGRLYREGSTLKLQNSPQSPKLLIVEQFGFNHYFNNEIFQWIDALAQTGVNGMRVFGFWPFGKGQETEPYLKSGNRYDLNRFNDQYFEYLRRWVNYANDKGVYVLYELFDSCGFWSAEHFPYNPFYETVKGSRQPHIAFSDLNNKSLVDVQKRYIKKVIDTVRPDQNENVLFGIMNEYKGDKAWHYEMSKYVKSLAPRTLIAGSEEDAKAADDPNVDLWFIHTGTYDFNSGKPNVPSDAREMQRRTGSQTVIGFSTDGFGERNKHRENPTDMKRLAQDVKNAGLQLLSFLDQKAYRETGGGWPGKVSQLNLETYRTLVEEVRPVPAPNAQGSSAEAEETPASPIVTEELPNGYFDIFEASRLPSTHADAFVELGGKAIRATTKQGFLVYGQYRKGYPKKPLKAYFSILTDNNTADDRNILILDVYDHHSDRVLGKRTITRKDFQCAGDYSLFEFDFTPPSESANMEFRVYYMGWAYIRVNKIAIVDPAVVKITKPSEIPNVGYTPPLQPVTEKEPVQEDQQKPVVVEDSDYCSGSTILCVPSMTPEHVAKYRGKVHGGNYQNGQFIPTTTGGIEFSFTIDASRQYAIDFEIEGNIPNWEKGESDGGKPSLFTLYEAGGHYYLNLQRMYRDYRGGGVFRVILADRAHIEGNAAFLPTISGFGAYDMRKWGNERHRFRILVNGNQCQLKIDNNYTSNWARAPYAIGGQRQVTFMLGNREASVLRAGQGVITRFQRVKIYYL